MRDFKFTESERPTMANFNQRFQSIADLANGLGNEYVWAKSNDTGIVGYVNSQDTNAYPPAVSDGYTYTALGQLGSKIRIETGSYVGTGTYGASNPNSLTFDFVPKFVIVQSEFQAGMLFWVSGMSGTVYRILRSSSTEYVGKITFSENTLTWYGTNAENQMNYSNYVYHYIAIG